MHEDPSTSDPTFYKAFPPHSINVIASSTNSGKTFLTVHILKNRDVYFSRPFDRVCIVLCNPKINPSPYEINDPCLQVDLLSLEEFNIEEHLCKNTFVIFEDVQFLNKKITETINIYAHHLDLASVFIVCQGLLGSDDLVRLLSLSHRVLLFFSSAAGSRLSKYILSAFFQDLDIKEHLRGIISYSEKTKSILLLEINQLNGEFKPKFVALSGLGSLTSDTTTIEPESEGDNIMPHKKKQKIDPPVIFPHYHEKELYADNFSDNYAEVDNFDPESLPLGSYVLVPARNVTRRSKKRKRGINDDGDSDDDDETDCHKKWNDVVHTIEDDIDSAIPVKKHLIAKNVLKFMLRSKRFCVTKDGKTIKIQGHPKLSLPILDFIMTAIRQSGPNEESDPLHVQFAKIMLQSNTPKAFFKNKALLTDALSGRSRKKVKRLQQKQFKTIKRRKY